MTHTHTQKEADYDFQSNMEKQYVKSKHISNNRFSSNNENLHFFYYFNSMLDALAQIKE